MKGDVPERVKSIVVQGKEIYSAFNYQGINQTTDLQYTRGEENEEGSSVLSVQFG